MRAIAVICVLVFHGGLPPRGGFLGVDVFFVLSGYLITVLLLVEVRRTGTIRLRRFYTRRAIRLLPALCVMLGTVVTVAIITLPATSKHEVLLANIYGLLYVANWAEVAGVPMGPLGHLWSLALEEQFYLVWPPTLMWLLRRRNSAFRFLLAVVGAITVWRSFLVLAGAPWDYLYYASDVRFDGLLVGCLLGVMIWDRLDVDRSSWCWRAAGWAALAVIAVCLFGARVESPWLYFGILSLFYVAVCLVIVVGSGARSWLPGRILGLKPLVYIGRMSYGLYLWHAPVFWFFSRGLFGLEGHTQVAAAGLTTVGATTLSYFVIERPLLAIRDRFR